MIEIILWIITWKINYMWQNGVVLALTNIRTLIVVSHFYYLFNLNMLKTYYSEFIATFPKPQWIYLQNRSIPCRVIQFVYLNGKETKYFLHICKLIERKHSDIWSNIFIAFPKIGESALSLNVHVLLFRVLYSQHEWKKYYTWYALLRVEKKYLSHFLLNCYFFCRHIVVKQK